MNTSDQTDHKTTDPKRPYLYGLPVRVPPGATVSQTHHEILTSCLVAGIDTLLVSMRAWNQPVALDRLGDLLNEMIGDKAPIPPEGILKIAALDNMICLEGEPSLALLVKSLVDPWKAMFVLTERGTERAEALLQTDPFPLFGFVSTRCERCGVDHLIPTGGTIDPTRFLHNEPKAAFAPEQN